MALSGKKRGRPAAKKAGRPRKASRMRDAWASRPKDLASIAKRESQKKAGGKRKGGGGGTATVSIYETLSIKSNERKTFAEAVGVNSIDDLQKFCGKFESENTESLTKGRARGMQLGAAWAAATAPGGFIERMKIPHEEAARQIGYHVQSLRLDARVFRRRHDVSEAVNLYEMHKDEIAFRPRKNDGVDFDRDCLRLLDAARNVAGKTDDGQWLEPTVDDVVAASTALVPVGGTRPPQAVSADQKMLRWASIAGYCLAVMAQRGIKTALGDFENIEQLEKAVTETMWDKETDLALFDHVKGQPFDTMNVGMADEAAEPFAGRLIDHATKANEEEEHPKKKAASGKTGNGRKKAGNGRRKKQAAPVETTSTEPTPTEPTPTAPDDTTGEG